MSLFDDNIEWIQPGESAIGGAYRGERELSDWFGRVTQKSATVKPRRFLAGGDTVVVLSEVTVANEKTRDADVYTLRGGKAIRAETYVDTALSERIRGSKHSVAG